MSPTAAGGLTHEEWQQQVVDLAHALGWEHLHVRRTIGRGKRWTTSTNIVGWPDLFMWHPRKGCWLAVELKVGRDRATPQQLAVLRSLLETGASVAVAYPHDLDELKEMLIHPGSAFASLGLPDEL